MAVFEEYGERTEQPTAHRLAEARRRGQVARSGDLVSALVVLGAVLVLGALGGGLVEDLRRMLAAMIQTPTIGVADAAQLGGQLWSAAGPALLHLAILLAAVMALATGGNLIQVGFLVAGESITMDPSRISPAAGLRRVFGAQSAARVGMSLAKMAAVAALCWLAIGPVIAAAAGVSDQSAGQVAQWCGQTLYSLALRVGLVLLALGVCDYLYQRWQHRRNLNMTPRELREELRQMDGDPQLRGRRKHLGRRIAAQRIAIGADNASVVLASGSGLAVAIRFAPPMRCPRVVVKGKDETARRLTAQAHEAGLAVVEDRDLTLAIYRSCGVGHFVPRRWQSRVAEILAYGEQVKGGRQPQHPHVSTWGFNDHNHNISMFPHGASTTTTTTTASPSSAGGFNDNNHNNDYSTPSLTHRPSNNNSGSNNG